MSSVQPTPAKVQELLQDNCSSLYEEVSQTGVEGNQVLIHCFAAIIYCRRLFAFVQVLFPLLLRVLLVLISSLALLSCYHLLLLLVKKWFLSIIAFALRTVLVS